MPARADSPRADMSSRSVVIAGCGYVGEALAQNLALGGWDVSAVTRSDESAASLSRRNAFRVLTADLSDTRAVSWIRERLGGAPRAIVHCASSGRNGVDAYRSIYLGGARRLIETFPEASVLFTSSSSVYAQTDGSVVTEESPTEPDRDTGKILLETEALVRESGGIVARLAGIYGPGRSVYVQKMLEGTATIESGDVSRYINQAHRFDIVSALTFLLEDAVNLAGQTFNVVDDDHPTQRELYEKLAAFLDLPVPGEEPPVPNRKRGWTNKRVSNEKLKSTGWQPIYGSLLEALERDPELLPSIQVLTGDNASSRSRS